MSSRQCFVTHVAGILGLIVCGVLALLMPTILVEPFTLHVFQFPSVAIAAITFLAALLRLFGFLNAIPGLFGSLLLQRYRIERQTWILRLITAVSLLAHVDPIDLESRLAPSAFSR